LKKYSLNIAGYLIGFESGDRGPDLAPSQRFLRNISSDPRSDIQISVYSEPYHIPKEAERVFHAPFLKEVNGVVVEKKENFWSIYKDKLNLFIKTIFPQSFSGEEGVLKFSLTSQNWELYVPGAAKAIDPLEYPLDGLILYYLTAIYGDIMIHASGVEYAKQGYLFSGVSGKGKSTIAGLWQKAGAKVIHDDRLIIRKVPEGFRMFNTPVYNDDTPLSSPLNKIYLIEHGPENKTVPVGGAAAVSLVMANCIQHGWNQEIVKNLMGSISLLCERIPVAKLSFKPDQSITDFLNGYE
jgi:hypothetical protein